MDYILDVPVCVFFLWSLFFFFENLEHFINESVRRPYLHRNNQSKPAKTQQNFMES
jgi:hypothetical protein